MKLDKDSFVRLFHEGSAFWNTGCGHSFMPGGMEEWTGWRDEQMSWKTDCYIGDWTPCLDDLYLTGKDALPFLMSITSNSFKNFAIGKAKHYVQCDANGKVMAEGVLQFIDEDKYLLQSNTGYTLYQYYKQADKYPDLKVYQPDWYVLEEYGLAITADRFKFQVSGPKALALSQKVTGENLTDLKFMNFRKVKVNNVECIALRQGMAGEVGFEFQGPIEQLTAVRNYIFEAGREFNCRRLGYKTAMINHLEACFSTYGVHYVAPMNEEYDSYQRESGFGPYYPAICGSYDGDWDGLTHSPYEMGWSSCVKFDHDFIGREALEKECNHVKKQIVTLDFDPEDMISLYASLYQTEQEPYELNDLPMNSYCHVQADKILSLDGKEIGISTTPGYSYYFRKTLALSFIDTEYAVPGTKVQVLWGSPEKPQKLIHATVQPAPYKKDNRKIDLKSIDEKRF